jgi:diacylglycerol kinase family enzyme
MNNTKHQYIIIINPNCHQGKGWDKWLLIKKKVMESLPEHGYIFVLTPEFSFDTDITPLLTDKKGNIIISAGGDGSIHYLINYVLGLSDEILHTISIGAIGLGSSNDFLKPYGQKIEGIPVKFDWTKEPILSDVGLVRFNDSNDVNHKKYFIINASLGVTAFANNNFNHPKEWLKFLKKYSTNTAILFTAIYSIFSYKNIFMKISFDGRTLVSPVANINILKIPYVSGSLHYTVPVKPDDGSLSLNICLNMTKWELLKVLYNLSKGIFQIGKKTRSVSTDNLEVSSNEPLIFECDGETETAGKVTLSIISKVINILK